MRRTALLLLITALLSPPAAFAGVDGADFDGMALGPYIGPADILEGDVTCVIITQVGPPPAHMAPTPPGASGQMLCIDAVNKADRIIVEFDFSCATLVGGVCQVSYDYGFAQWHGSGVEVHIDAGGDYSNPDDKLDIPIGFPPSTAAGDNTETEGSCDNSTHTVSFVVSPGSIIYIDNLVTKCLLPTPTKKTTWGELKVKHR